MMRSASLSDTAVAGNRERDIVTGMTIPPSLTGRSLPQLCWKMVMARGIETQSGFYAGKPR